MKRRSAFLSAGLLLAALLALGTAAGARELRLEAVRVHPPGGAEERVLLSLLRLSPGDRVDPEVLLRAREGLEESGRFEELTLYTERGAQPGRVLLHVDATLRRGARFETGFGHEPLHGWYLNLAGLRWMDPLGRGGELWLGARLGLRRSGAVLEATQPRIGGLPIDLLVAASSVDEQWNAYEGDQLRQQSVQRGRAAVGLRGWLAGDVQAVLWAGVGSDEPDTLLVGADDTEDEGAGRLVPALGRETTHELRLELTLDRRDRAALWRGGWWAGLRVGGSDRVGGEAFWRVDADVRGALPLPGQGALALRGAAGRCGEDTPYHRRFVFGGTGSLRGFRDASLSGPEGARAFWLASSELRMPLVGRGDDDPRVIGVLFGELGDHWDPRLQRRGLDAGVGYGLRVRVPWIQRFGLDVGIPLTPTTTDDPFWVHLSLGFAF